MQERDLVQTSDEVSLAYANDINSELYMQIESKDTEEDPDLMDPEKWIGDTGATTHSTAHNYATCNHRNVTPVDDVFGVTGPPAKAQTIVDIPAVIMEKNGENKRVMICDVTYVPNGWYNIFSITKMLKAGWQLLGDMEKGLVLTKGQTSIKFERKVHTTKGLLFVA